MRVESRFASMSCAAASVSLVLVVFLVLTGCEATGNGGPTLQTVEDHELSIPAGEQGGSGVEVVDGPTETVVEQTAPSLVVRLESFGGFVPDPAAEVSGYSDSYLAEIYEGLTRFGHDGVELGLADGYTVSSSGTEYEFTLRPELKFSNGEPVTAADFKWSWERALPPRYSRGGGREALGHIEGADALAAGDDDELAGVVVVDDRTLSVSLVSVLPTFPELLAEPAATVLHRPNVESWGFDWSRWRDPEPSHIRPWYFDELPVGTGPFALTEFDYWDDSAVFIRNEHYWDGPAGLDRIELVSLDDPPEIRSAERLLGERVVDVVYALGGSALPGDVTGLGGPVPVRFSVPPVVDLLVLAPDADDTSEIHFRRALAAAVTEPSSTDTNVWTELGPYGSVGWYEAAGILPTDRTDELWDGTVLGDGIETALVELASVEVISGRGSGPVVLEYFDATHGPEDTHDQRIGSWSRELGVELSPVYTLDSDIWVPPAGRAVAVRRVRIAPTFDDPYSYLSGISKVLGSDNDAPEVARFRELLVSAVSETDVVDRLRRYRDVERHLVESALVIPLYVSSGYARSVAQPWLRGLERPLGPGSRFKEVWIYVDHPEYVPSD